MLSSALLSAVAMAAIAAFVQDVSSLRHRRHRGICESFRVPALAVLSHAECHLDEVERLARAKAMSSLSETSGVDVKVRAICNALSYTSRIQPHHWVRID